MPELLLEAELDEFAPCSDFESLYEGEHPVFDKAAVAELTRDEIGALPDQELARVVREVGVLTFCDNRRFELLDRTTLERLVYLARRCCRNQGY